MNKIIEEFWSLPPDAQRQAADFITFLHQRYNSPRSTDWEPIDKQPDRHSVLDVLAGVSGHQVFQTADTVDAHIREERDAWER